MGLPFLDTDKKIPQESYLLEIGESLLLRTGEWKVSPLKYRGMGRRQRGEQRWGIKRERRTVVGILRYSTVAAKKRGRRKPISRRALYILSEKKRGTLKNHAKKEMH